MLPLHRYHVPKLLCIGYITLIVDSYYLFIKVYEWFLQTVLNHLLENGTACEDASAPVYQSVATFVQLSFLNVFYVTAVLFENWANLRGKWHRVEERTLQGDTTLPLMFRDVVHSLCNGSIWILRRLFSTWCPGLQHCEQRSLIILCKGWLYYPASRSPGDFVLNNGFGGEAHLFKVNLR